jgi:hypothetical protein
MQRIFQNWLKNLKVQKSFTTYNVHDVLKKVVNYNKNIKI